MFSDLLKTYRVPGSISRILGVRLVGDPGSGADGGGFVARKAGVASYGRFTTGNTEVELVPENQNRVSLTVVNHGATVAYVNPTGAASATAGIALAPAQNVGSADLIPGGAIVDVESTAAWSVIVPSGTPDVRFVEFSYA